MIWKCCSIWVPLLFVAAFAAPLHAAPEVKATLLYKFTKDATLHYAADINMNMEFPGGAKQAVTAHSEMSMKVIAAAFESATLELRIDRMKSAIGAVVFDTGVKEDRERMEENPALKPILLMIGTPIKMTMKATGEVTSYDLAELKKKLDAVGMPQMTGMMKDQLDQLSSGSMILLPDHPVGKGDTWSGKLRTTAIGVGNIEVAYTLKLEAIEQIDGEKCARMSVTGAAVLKPDAAATEKPTLSKYVETGTVVFSIDRGRLVSSKVDGSMHLTLAGGQDVGVEMNIKIHEGEK